MKQVNILVPGTSAVNASDRRNGLAEALDGCGRIIMHSVMLVPDENGVFWACLTIAGERSRILSVTARCVPDATTDEELLDDD